MKSTKVHVVIAKCATILTALLAMSTLVARTTAEPRQSSLLVRSTLEGGGTALSANCAVHRDVDGWWFVSPEGKRFFSLGVSVVNQGTSRDEYDPARPSYAAWRHYDKPEAWSETSQRRLTSWGFTTIGGWSDLATLRESSEHDFWLTPVAHIGSQAGAPWWDMWDEKNIRRMDQIARNSIAPLRDDPRVIGYYSDNEIGWWDASLWKLTFEQVPTSSQRQRLIGLLRETYHDDWEALLKDFEPVNVETWQELERGGRLCLRPGGDGVLVVRHFLGLMAERYYQLMDELIHKYDPTALYLGDRYQSFYYPEVARASRRHVDVVSTNLNVSWNDGTFLRSYLDTLHALTGKPILVSEFYMAANENRSGNKNASSGFPTVGTQQERAEAMSNTVRSLTQLPYVVGVEWFQYYDEPPHGRPDGEDYNFGLVDILDQPYEEVTDAFASMNLMSRKAAGKKERADASSGVPPAPADPFAEFEFMRALKGWDRQRGFVPSASEHPIGDMYLCWSPDAVYLAVYVLDVVDREHYRDRKVPAADRGQWQVQVGDAEPFTLRLGYGGAPEMSDTTLRFKSLSGLNHGLRSITAVEIPAKRLGKECLKIGDRIDLEASYITHGRAYRMEWQGSYILSE